MKRIFLINMKNLKSKSGLILTEVLLAVALLSVGAIITGTLINNAVTTIRLSKNYLIAQNLATEGIEAVKNIRDTNWLREPNFLDDCWLRIDPDVGNCNDDAMADTNYMAKNGTDIWKLEPAIPDNDLDLTQELASNAQYQLFFEDHGTYKLFVTDDTGESTDFYRSIKFTSIGANNAEVEVNVQWTEGAKVRGLTRTAILYNYLAF